MAHQTVSRRQGRLRARERFADPTRRRGFLVAFEGPDGSGKTTRKLFKTRLESEGYNVVTTKWNSSDLIKPIIKTRKAVHAPSPTEFSLLHAADFRHRVEHVSRWHSFSTSSPSTWSSRSANSTIGFASCFAKARGARGLSGTSTR
jgi:hypothetical protein